MILRDRLLQDLKELEDLLSDNAELTEEVARLKQEIEDLKNQIPDCPIPDPDPDPNPLPFKLRPFDRSWQIDTQLFHFSHTAQRQWNYGGHEVPVPFAVAEGYWEPGVVGHSEPYLFDQVSCAYLWYELTGLAVDLAWANASFVSYANNITPQGFFALKTSDKLDTKYLYSRCFYLHFKHTPEAAITDWLPILKAMWGNVKKGYDAITPPKDQFRWTEREAWVHAEFSWFYYLITKDPLAKEFVEDIIRQIGTGVHKVSYTSHEGGGPVGSDDVFVSSPWMMALYLGFTPHVYGQISPEIDGIILSQLINYTNFLMTPAKKDRLGVLTEGFEGFCWGQDYHVNQTGLLAPRYLTENWSDGITQQSQQHHTLASMGLLSTARWARQVQGMPTEQIDWFLQELEKTAMNNFAYWTRDIGEKNKSLPLYRQQRPSFWNLWVRGRLGITQGAIYG